MAFVAETMTASPRVDGQMSALFSDGFPAFITADQEVKQHIGRVRSLFADLEMVLLDGDVIVAAAWGVPIWWSGEMASLPGGYTGTLRLALEQHDARTAPNTFVIMAAQVHPDRRG